MKKLRLLTKSVLFLSFFLPFFVVPSCDWGNQQMHHQQAIKDSLTKDSIMKDSLMKVSLDKAGLLKHYMDSVNNGLDFERKEKTSGIDLNQQNDSLNSHMDSISSLLNANSNNISNTQKRSISSYFSSFWNFLIYPKDYALSGFGFSVAFLLAPFQDLKSLEFSNLLCLLVSLPFFITIGTLISLFFRNNLKWHFYLSIISIIGILYLRVAFNGEDLLWGFYTALLFNLADIVVIYLSMKKEKVTNNFKTNEL